LLAICVPATGRFRLVAAGSSPVKYRQKQADGGVMSV
jgi:hypothetical protein